MKEHYVSYEQAVALKRLGFDEPCEFYYNPYREIRRSKDGPLSPQITNNRFLEEIADGMATAPRLDQAAAWMREEKGIFVGVTYDNNMSNYNPYGFRVQIPMCNDRSALGFHEYNQALSAGINKALELLGKEVKE